MNTVALETTWNEKKMSDFEYNRMLKYNIFKITIYFEEESTMNEH
jgi:hypothetical protein